MIEDHQCGLSVAPEDPESFADTLEYAADHRDDLKKMGLNARQLAKAQFNRNELAMQFVSWLEKSTSKHPMELEKIT